MPELSITSTASILGRGGGGADGAGVLQGQPHTARQMPRATTGEAGAGRAVIQGLCSEGKLPRLRFYW